ncbi:MAG: hypothetical protein U0167_02815 [bacterium]
MAWFSRFTRFGDMHLVYGQEANMSCGIASVIMCVFKINKLRPGSQAVQVEKDIYDKYSKASGGAYKPEQKGTRPEHLVTVLDSLDCGKWTWAAIPADSAANRIVQEVGIVHGLGPTVGVNPVIIGVDWDAGGAHWVVIDTIRHFNGKNYATICDPWDTNVHIEDVTAGKAFTYAAGQGGFKLDFWGTNKGQTSPYGATDMGRVKTWGMIYRTKKT